MEEKSTVGSIKGENKIWDRVKKALPIAVFISFTCLFYGPLSIYLPNSEEMWFTLGTLLKVVVPFSLFAIALMILFFAIIPDKIGSFFSKLLFGVGLALYVQGNWIKSDYGTGVFDGTEIEWDAYKTYGILNALLWVALIILPFVLCYVIQKVNKDIKSHTIITALALFLTVIQIPAFVIQGLSYNPNSRTDLKISTEGMFELSEKDNIIFVLLDAMDQLFYDEFIAENPDYTEELEGFINFSNTSASGYRTIIAMPSMLTGEPYLMKEPYTEYLDRVWSKDSALSLLHDGGYKVKIYAGTAVYTKEAIRFVDNFGSEEGEVSSYKKLLKKVYKLDLFKFAPHYMKKRFWLAPGELEAAQKMTDRYVTNDPQFFMDYRDARFSIDSNEDKMFVLYHLNGGHKPYTMGADTSKKKNATREEQVTGCFAGLKEMLDELKEKGLYDNSTIIICADHGDTTKGAHPLLLVKEQNSETEYSVSTAPVSLFDVGVYLANLAGKELPNQEYGKNLFEVKEDEDRERHFFRSVTIDNKMFIREFVVNGDIYNLDNIVEYEDHEDVEGKDAPYKLGTLLSFTADATGNKYAVEGFLHNNGFRTILFTRKSSLAIPIENPPKEGNLTVRIKFHQASRPYFTEFYANNHKIMELDITREMVKDDEIVYEVPVEYLNDDILELEFRIPDAPDEGDPDFEGDKRYTLSLEYIIIE